MSTKKEIDLEFEAKIISIKKDKEYGLRECKRCEGTKRRIILYEQTQLGDTNYVVVKTEFCDYCNDNGMVDLWCELMGKKWRDYATKIY